jgi:hypothetical protein
MASALLVSGLASLLAHLTFANPTLVFVAEGLFFVGIAAGIGCYRISRRPRTSGNRASIVGLGVVTVGCLLVASSLPFFVGQTIHRPSSTAQIAFVTPRAGETLHGTAGSIQVELKLDGGTIVPGSSLHLVPNEGHVHLYLDGALVQMIGGLHADVAASPGTHTLRAEFVALDHGPFRPPVMAEVTFQVAG